MEKRAEIVVGLAEILNEVVETDPADVTEDKHLGEDLDVDSLAMAEIVLAAEERFGITLPEEELHDVRFVSEVVTRIEMKMAS